MTVLDFFTVSIVVTSLVTLAYVVAVGGLILTVFAKQEGRRIAQPFVTMLQVTAVSSVVYVLASVPSIVARVVNPEILPFIMPFSAVLFAVCFVGFMLKLESKASGWKQAGVAVVLAALISVALIVGQLVLDSVLIS